MQFIYVLKLTERYTRPENWTAETNQIVGAHFNYLKGLFESGIVKFVGKTEYGIEHPDNWGISIFEAANEDEAQKIMQQDPCIINGVMTASLHPFRTVFNAGQN